MNHLVKIGAAGLLATSLLGAQAQAQTISAEAQAVLDLAAELYPDIFTDGGDLKEAQGYVYRFFAQSGVYVGFKDGSVHLWGGPGTEITSKGTISQARSKLEDIREDNAVSPSADVLELFAAGAQAFPDLFGEEGEFKVGADGLLYREFDSGVSVGIRNGAVYLRGGTYGRVFTNVGTLNAILAKLDQVNGGSGNPNPGIPEGDYTLTITGKITQTLPIVGNITTNLDAFVIQNMAAPNPSDQDDIEEAFDVFLDQMDDVEGLVVTSKSHQVISTSDPIEFSMAVAATMQTQAGPVNISYALNFKYTK